MEKNDLKHTDMEPFRDWKLRCWPPRDLHKAVLSLTGSEEIIAGSGETTRGDSNTEWSLLALTDKRLIIVSGEAPIDDWSWDTPVNQEHQLKASARSLHSVHSVSVETVQHLHSGFGDSTTWTADYVIHFEDVSVPLPRATTATFAQQREQIEAFAQAVLDRTK